MTIHCPECDEGKACGNFHVYVIELNKSVLEKKPSFPFEGPLETGKKVYYVGQTRHSVECRHKQHVAPRHKRSRRGFYRNCFTDETELKPFTTFNRPGNYVNKYHKKGGLRPELYADRNPAVKIALETYAGMMENLKSEAEAAEEELALYLRSLGHAVHYN